MEKSYGRTVEQHLPCWDCDSSDAAAIYQDAKDPSRYYGKCYSNDCTKQFTEEEALKYVEDVKGTRVSAPKVNSSIADELPEFKKPPAPIRGIPTDVLSRYKVDWFKKDDGSLVAHNYRYGTKTDKGWEYTCIKHRYANKEFRWTKLTQESPREAGFFGQGCSFEPSKSVMITEGEIDAMSAYHLLDHKMPVVSLKNGAGDVRVNESQKEFLDKFELIYLCFDMDDNGETAAKRFSQAFPPSKIRVVHLEGVKDANQALLHGRRKQFNMSVAMSTSVIREGFILGKDTKKYLFEEPEKLHEYPWKGLNDMCYGISDAGELIVLLSGSGSGKTTILKTLALHYFHTTPWTIGTMFFEENAKKKTIRLMCGMHIGKNQALPDIREETTDEEIGEAWDAVFDNDRWVIKDKWGSEDTSAIIDTIRYMVVNFGVKLILLDHLSIIFSGSTDANERKAIDKLMTDLRTLIDELEFSVVAVCHLTKKNDGLGHEEGARVGLKDARGAGSIYQLADTVLGAERNQQDESKAHRLLILLRVLKSRTSGETGPATRLGWNKAKGLLREISEDDFKTLNGIPDPIEQIMFVEGDYDDQGNAENG